MFENNMTNLNRPTQEILHFSLAFKPTISDQPADFLSFFLYILMPPFKEERSFCFAHGVCPSVCNRFVSDQYLENTLTYLLQTWSKHPSWVADKPY